MSSGVPGPWIRRPVSITTVTLGAVLAAPLVIPLFVLALVVDLVTRTRPRRRARLVWLISTLLWVDLFGVIATAGAWLISPFGLRTQSDTDQRRYHWVMTWWGTMLLNAIGRWVPLSFDFSQIDDETMRGNAIMIGRHRSVLDAILPVRLIGSRGLTALYTLKEDLRWEPNIDIVGHRMGHRFVTRAPEDPETELEPLRELGRRIDGDSIGVIFPEGTFFTQERKAKIIASLAKTSPRLAEKATSMNHLLPPKPGGTLALLEGAPEADVIVYGHTGFEDFGTIGNIIRNLGGDRSITLTARRIPRSEIPDETDLQVDWLFDQWQQLDDWVESTLQTTGPSGPSDSAFAS